MQRLLCQREGESAQDTFSRDARKPERIIVRKDALESKNTLKSLYFGDSMRISKHRSARK